MSTDLERLRRAARDGDYDSAWMLWHEAERRSDLELAVEAAFGLADPDLAGQLAERFWTTDSARLDALLRGFGVVLEMSRRERIDIMLAAANGQRRVRRLTPAAVIAALCEARSAPLGIAHRHAGDAMASPSNPRSAVTVSVRLDDGTLALGITECSASSPSPGRGWSALAPWRPELEATTQRARAWAADTGREPTRMRLTSTDETPVTERLKARLSRPPVPGDELEALLVGPPTDKTFKAILKKLDSWPKTDAAGRDAAVARARRVTADWPAEACVATASIWKRLEKGGKDKPSDVLLRHLDLDKVTEAMLHQIAASPATTRFESIKLTQVHDVEGADRWKPAGFEALVRSPHLAGLRRLELNIPLNMTEDISTVLTAGSGLVALEELDLRAHYRAQQPAGDPADFGRYALPAVRRLDLGGCSLSAERIRALVSAPAIASVRELVLDAAKLTADAAKAIAESPYLEGLEVLSLSNSGVGDEALSALAQSTTLRSLQALVLTENRKLTEVGLAALARSPFSGTLRVLELNGVPHSGKMLEALCHGGGLTRLERLNLRYLAFGGRTDRLGVAGAKALAAAPFARTLRELELTSLGDEGAQALGEAPFECLEKLNLSNCDIGPAGAIALAANPHLGLLEDLRLSSDPIGCEGFAALVRSPYLSRLRVLVASNCNIGAEGAKALAESDALPALETLILNGNAPQVAGTAAMAASEKLERLRWLSLSSCTLGKGAVQVLEASPYLVGRFTGVPGHRSDDRAF